MDLGDVVDAALRRSCAVKFTAAGGRVEVSTRLDDGQIELTVSDSGIGIDATFLNRHLTEPR